MRRNNILLNIFLIIIIILSISADALSQQKIIVFAKPFQAKGVPESFTSNATQLFRSKLSESKRFGLVSEEHWREVMQTQGIYLENITIFDQENDLQIGKLVKAKRLITGKMEQYETKFLISVNWINLETGITDKTIIKEMESRDQLKATIEEIVFDIERMFVSTGNISSINGDIVRIKIKSKNEEWKVGTIFNLINTKNEAYGKVKIVSKEGHEAIGQTYDLRDFVKKGDNVEIASLESVEKQLLKNVGLMYCEGLPDRTIINDLYLSCQTLLNKCNRVNLFDDQTVKDVMFGNSKIKMEYVIDGEILKDIRSETYTVTMRLKDFKTSQIIKQDTEKCLKPKIVKTAKILLQNIITHFPLQGIVTKIDNKEIAVNLGKEQNIKRKMEFSIRSAETQMIISEGKVDKVFRDYFIIKQREKFKSVNLGTIVEMKENEDQLKKLAKEREKIWEEYEEQVQNILDKDEQKKRAEKLKQEKIQRTIQARLAPKSRLKLSIGKALFGDETMKVQFEGNNTGQFKAGLYLGDHPNFNISLNYQYSYFKDNTIESGSKKSFIEEQAGGLGARVQIVVPFLFSLKFMPFAEGKIEYSSFKSKLDENSEISFSEPEWNGFYLIADGGLEIVFDNKFSLFAQAGFNRVLKLDENLPKFEFMFIDGGIAIWF